MNVPDWQRGKAASIDERDVVRVPPGHSRRRTATRSLVCLTLVAALFASPRPAAADWTSDPAAEPVAEEQGPRTRGTPALWATGLGLTGGTWLVGVVVFFGSTFSLLDCDRKSLADANDAHLEACQRESDERGRAAPMLAPLVGPFIAAGTLKEDGSIAGSMLVLGTAQVLSAGLIVAGLAWRHPVPPKRPLYPVPTVVPVMGPGHAGLAVHGRF